MCKKLSNLEIQSISDNHFGFIKFIQRAENSRYGFFFCSEHKTTSRQYLNSHINGINPCKICRKKIGRPRRNSISDINQKLKVKFDGKIHFHSYHQEEKAKAYFECSVHGKTKEKYLGNVLHSKQRNNPCNECQKNEIFEPDNKLSIKDINIRLEKNKSNLTIIRRKVNNSKYGIFRCKIHGHVKKALTLYSVLNESAECPRCKEKRLPPPNKFTKSTIQNLSDKALGNFIFLGRCKNDHKAGFFICQTHFEKGIQKQLISNHIRGANPCCGKISKGEKKIANYLINQGFKFSQNKSFEECKNTYPLPFDFFVHDLNLLIEFDGEQHYKAIARFGGNKKHAKIKQHDEIKTHFAVNRGFNFLRIPYTHFSRIHAILKNSISRIKDGEKVIEEFKLERNKKHISFSIQSKQQ